MPSFDPNLDKELFAESSDFERTVIAVKVMAYNEGQPKIQITRQNKRADDALSFAKLGRMSKEEAEAVMPLLQKALDFLNKQ